MAVRRSSITINYHETASNAITDLTGTKWLLNNSLTITSNRTWYVSGGLNVSYPEENINEISLEYDDTEPPVFTALNYMGLYEEAWSSEAGWAQDEFKSIFITGGSDATNSDLIAWLQANATQIEDEPTITDLTGTRWKLNAIPAVNNTSFNVYGAVEGIEGFTRIMHQFSSPVASVTFSNGGTQSQAMVFYGTGSTYRGWYRKGRGSASSATYTPLETPPIIKFTRGTDISNPNLIAWVQANATQLHAGNFSFGNLPIENMYFGTRQVKKIYMGNALVWESATEPIPDNALFAQDGALLTTDGGYLITTEVTLITFDIYGDTYQAEEGMTWGEWVNSEYNTDGYKVANGGRIYNSASTSWVIDPVRNAVSSSDIIVANTSYSRLAGGGADQ